jgi:hypothetical protein
MGKKLYEIFVPIFISGLVFMVVDQIFYDQSLENRNEQNLHISFRHSAYSNVTGQPSSFYIEKSNALIHVGQTKFRTGSLGNILPIGGNEESKCRVAFLGGSSTESRWMPENI